MAGADRTASLPDQVLNGESTHGDAAPGRRAARRAQALPDPDDLQRDRALRHTPPGRRLPAPYHPPPAAGAGRHRRLRGDEPDLGGPPRARGPPPDLLADYLRYVAAAAGPEDRGRRGHRRPAGLGGPVRRGHRHDPPEARLRRTRHQRLPARPRRGAGPGVPALRPQPVREPRLCPTGRLRQAGHDRRGRRSGPATCSTPTSTASASSPWRSPRSSPRPAPRSSAASGPCSRSAGRHDFDLEEYLKLRMGLQAKIRE